MNESFIDWLREELRKRDMSQAELARRAGLSASNISMTISGKKAVGINTIQGIATAFGYPDDFVMVKAGLLPDPGNLRNIKEQIVSHKTSELSEDELDELLTYIEFMQSRPTKPKSGFNRYEVTRREGETPPEMIND